MDDPSTAILVVAALLLVKESGLPVPVPGDLLVIGAGVAAAAATASSPLAGVAVVVLATIAGGAAQFALIRGPGRRAMLGLLARVGIGEARVRSRIAGLRGARSIALARMTPGLRIVAIPAAAIGDVPARSFVAGLAVGNTVFVGGHFLLGYVVGEPARAIASRALGPLAAGILVLAVLGAGGWWLLGRYRAARGRAATPAGGGLVTPDEGAPVTPDEGAPATPDEGAPVAAWADAACPACLVLAALRPAARAVPGA